MYNTKAMKTQRFAYLMFGIGERLSANRISMFVGR